ncbi:MAG: hypothetical protein LJF30_19880 [Acidobacteria bacterium]|jgi:hypothetical protein|nr:hypothetical protein [Acidobacteriota bacterium]
MRAYLKAELEQFLEAVDAALDRPAEVVLIGGAAAALHYGATRPTRDIDTWTTIHEELAQAASRARASTGLDVPVQHSGVADAPSNFESRLERVLPDLAVLVVFVPERHDLVLMKAVRAYEHDLEVIAEIHARFPLELETLAGRFEAEMSPIGDRIRIRGNFLAVVERIFPSRVDLVAQRLERVR